jgi:MFS family permease
VLLVSRLFLGGVQATSGPTLGSLIGDFFPAGDRGRINGYILSGELVGGGLGFVVCGEIAAALTWRWAFWALILPGLVLSVLLWRLLPEPERGRMSRLTGSEPSEDSLKKVAARRLGSARGPVLAEDPRRMNLWRAVRYVCRSARTSR